MEIESILIVVLSAILMAVTIIDIRTQKIPDILSLGGIVLILFLKILEGEQPLLYHLINIVIGFIPFFLIWYLTKGKMGLGDAKLSSLLALALGIRGWLLMLILSSSIAILFALTMLLLHKMDKHSKIAYAPFLSVGAFLVIILT